MQSFKQYLTEESAFSKVRKKPYRILGQFVPSKFDDRTIQNEFDDWIDNNTKYTSFSVNVRDPEDNHRMTWKGHDTITRLYHQDVSNNPKKFVILWANKNPTKIKTIKTNKEGKITYRNMDNSPSNDLRLGRKYPEPGEDVGHDIKPNDVILLYNRRAVHRADTSKDAQKDRWFARAFVRKNVKKK